MHLMLYFSGTGNTRFAIEEYGKSFNHVECYSIEEQVDFKKKITEANEITIAYPIYTSMLPDNMRIFLVEHKLSFFGKKVNVLITQMMFSGDGAMLAIRLLGKRNIIVGNRVHISLPNNISDIRFLRIVDQEKLQIIRKKKQIKIKKITVKISKGKRYKHGARFFSRILGYTLQRFYGPRFHKKYENAWRVDNQCIHCLKCVNQCPVNNLFDQDGMITAKGQCILCYRCVNICPSKSISIIGKHKPKVQYINQEMS